MNVPSLQRLTVLSFIFHITFFGTVFMAIKQSARFVIPSSYVVNLVESDIRSEEPKGVQSVGQSPAPEVLKAVPKKEETVAPSPKETRKLSPKEDQQLQDRIAALEAKKKIARIARVRSEMKKIPQKGSAVQAKAVGSTMTSGKRDGAVIGNYISGVRAAIHRQYEITPDIAKKNLEATVSMRIMNDGSIRDAQIIQRSGNSLFDRSVLKAIAKASPVAPPPDGKEIEAEVKFNSSL